MSQRGLEALLKPKSIAVIGASAKPRRAGELVMHNLLASGFSGSILPVNPNYSAVCGVMTYPTIADLPLVPDLAIICTHGKRIEALLEALSKKGCPSCILLSAPNERFDQLQQRAAALNIRLLGPNSLGLIAPYQGLNASFSPVPVAKGNVAFIAQSPAVANTLLDWAQQRQLGFSWFIALGESVDIDIDDILDFLARDSKTTAILICLEHLRDARRFLSAARSAARNKPVVLFKSGRTRAARQLLGNTATFDGTWDAAIQRAGMLRVYDTHELFSAVESLSRMRHLQGESLFIISNGVAPAALAIDTLLSRQGKLAQLDAYTEQQLRRVLPASITLSNPLDLKDDATSQRYLDVMNILLDSHSADAIMVIHAPSAASPATECAEKLTALLQQHPRARTTAILTNWCGEYSSQEARAIFSQAGIPTWRTPEGTITAFMHRVTFYRNQKQLRETPTRMAIQGAHRTSARAQLQALLAAEIYHLPPEQLKLLITSFGLIGVDTPAPSSEGPQKLRLVAYSDPLFGPIVLLGEQSNYWQEDQQAVTALLPLNMALARHLLTQGIMQQKLGRLWPLSTDNILQLSQLLVHLSELIIECPEIQQLELILHIFQHAPLSLNSAYADLSPFTGDSEDRLAIRPYPQRFEESVQLADGRHCLLRPILPEDEPQLRAFISKVTKEDLYYRYFSEINEFTHEDLANMTQIDYDREMAFVAVIAENDLETIIGVTRAISDSDNIDAEFSILIRSDLKRLGLGRKLLEKMIRYTGDHGLKVLNGITMPTNLGMIALAKKLGFQTKNQFDEGIVSLQLQLDSDEVK